MVRRSLYIAVATAAAVMILTVSANSQGVGSNTKQFWGTWVHNVHVGPGFSVPALVTIHFDGTINVSSGLMFGGLVGSTRRVSPVHSVWEKTGPKSIGATSLFFTFDAVTGVLTGYQRNRCSLEAGDDFTTYQGTEFMETLSCPYPLSCPDPLNPAATWTPVPGMPATGYPVSGARLKLVPSGALTP